MALSAFDDKKTRPDAKAIASVLGKTSSLWTSLREALERAHGPLGEEWVYPGKPSGWSLRLKQKSRALLYVTPCRGYFMAAFVLGEKACRAAHDSGLPPDILAAIDAAPKYVEGRVLRMEVRSLKDLRHIQQIAAIKAAN